MRNITYVPLLVTITSNRSIPQHIIVTTYDWRPEAVDTEHVVLEWDIQASPAIWHMSVKRRDSLDDVYQLHSCHAFFRRQLISKLRSSYFFDHNTQRSPSWLEFFAAVELNNMSDLMWYRIRNLTLTMPS